MVDKARRKEDLLAFLAEQAKHYKAEILPQYPTEEMDSFEEFDMAKNEFLESLWDVVKQYFDDLGANDEETQDDTPTFESAT